MKRLWTTFRYTIKGFRWQIIGWGAGIALYGLLIIPMYTTLGANAGQFQQMIASYPPEFLAFFGADVNSPLTPSGFLSMYAFSMLPVIVGVFSVVAGTGLIVNDEERGRLDLIIAHPVGRLSLFWGRFLGMLGSALVIMLLGWVGFSALLGRSTMEISAGQMAIPFLTLFAQVLVYLSLGLLLSMLMPSRNLAAMVTGAVMILSYLITSLSYLNDNLHTVAQLLPYHYFQSVLSIGQLNLAWLVALLATSMGMTLFAYLRFYRRDIRLTGEGSWRKR